MADITYHDHPEDNSPTALDEIPYWDVTDNGPKRATRAAMIGAALTGGGSIVTGGFTLTIPANGTAALTSHDFYHKTSVLLVDANFSASPALSNRYQTITAALAACTGGETILIAPGIYSETVTIGADGVKLIGSGMPRYDGASGRLVGGTIIRGQIDCASKVGVVVRDLGVDGFGLTVDGIVATNLTTETTPVYQTYRNIALLGGGQAAQDHAIRINGGRFVHVDNIRMWYWYHGLAILASDVTASNIQAYACLGSAVIVKGKTNAGNAHRVNVSNVTMDGDSSDPLTRSGPVMVEADGAPYSVRYVNISNVTAKNCVNGAVRVQRIAGAGTISDIVFNNVSSDANLDLAAVGDFCVKNGSNITFTNCRSTNRAGGYGWRVDPADSPGAVHVYSGTGDGSGSGDYTGAFAALEVNGVAYDGINLWPTVAFRSSAINGASAAAAGISVTGANTPVAKLSAPDGATNDYAGLLLIWVRNATGSSANSALWTVVVMKGNHGGTQVFAAELSQLGPTGTGASAPNFTFAVNGATNQLQATPTDSASGTFFFGFTAIGNIRVEAL